MIPETLLNIGLPPKKTTKDHVSAHRLAVLTLIKEFCIIKNRYRNGNSPCIVNTETWEQTNQQKRDFSIVTMKLIQNPDTELKVLNDCVLKILHKKTYEQFLNGLRELRLNGVASLMDFVLSLEELLVEQQQKPPIVHRSSVLGLFIRRMNLAFDKLSFSNVIKLHSKYCDYYDQLFGLVASKAENETIDEDTTTKDNEDCNSILASQKQAEFFISQQATLFQINEQEALLPAPLQKKINELLRGNPDFAEAHYLSYLNSLRVKEYLGALRNLHHYFDRSTTLTQDSKPPIGCEDNNRSFRYAALNLAILHAKFGHKDESLAALKESITMAQEASDNVCLQHALSWLYQVSPDNRDTLIERSITKTGELSLWYLSSIGIQALCKSRALSGIDPVVVFDELMKSDITNCHHSITELLGTALAQRAALWYLYGNSSMGDLCSQILLFLNTSDPSKGRIYHVGEGTCLSLTNLALFLSQKGCYEGATTTLGLAKNLFAPHNDNAAIWMQCEQTIIFERALYQGHWQEAEKAVSAIKIFNELEGKLRQGDLNLQTGNSTTAHKLITELLEECRKENGPNTHFYVRVLLLQSRLFLQCLQAAKAVSPLTLALSLCDECHLLHLQTIVQMHLAAAQYLMELPSQALHLLNKTYISAQAHGTTYEVACLQLLYAKCLVAESKMNALNNRRVAYDKALNFLKKSEYLFRQIEAFNRAKDTLYWQALLFNELHLTQERNKCSLAFRILEEHTKSFDSNAVLIP